jgi:hypothetical protein
VARYVLANRRKSLHYVEGAIILLMVVVFMIRVAESYSYWGRAFIQSGLFHDSVCYRGSYEMIICSPSLPPFETYLAALGILLVVSILVSSRKTNQ